MYGFSQTVIGAPGAYLILKLCGVSLIGEWYLKERDAYFKVRGIIHLKFQNFVNFSLQVTISSYNYNI